MLWCSAVLQTFVPPVVDVRLSFDIRGSLSWLSAASFIPHMTHSHTSF